MSLFGLLVTGFLFWVAVEHHTAAAAWPILLAMALAFPVIFLGFTLPTLLFSIDVGGGRVRLMFLNRHVMTDKPIKDLQGMLWGRNTWGAILCFEDGSRIYFLGAHLRVLQALNQALAEAKAGL